MKIYYAKNSNGKYLSADGQTRYEKFCGRAAYTYLKSNEGKDKRFAKISDADDLNEVFLEIDTDSIPTFRVDERREQYVRDTKREPGICVISIYACEGQGDDDDKVSGEELIADESIDLESEALGSRIIAINESLARDNSRKDRLQRIQEIIAQRRIDSDTYDDSIVRQMIECIEVFKDGTLLIHFGGGYEIEEHI